MKIDSNKNISFQAKLTTSFLPDKPTKWKRVEKAFQSKTKDLQDYELLLFKNEKTNDELVISTYNNETNIQTFNLLGKKGSKMLEELSSSEIVEKLVKFVKLIAKKEQDENVKFNNYLARFKNPDFIDENRIEKFYKRTSKDLNKSIIKELNTDDVFKNELKLDVNPITVFKDHYVEFKQ